MKTLKIGQTVMVTGKALVGYSWINEIEAQRRLEWWSTEPFMAVVVGQVVKQLGTYCSGSSRNWYGQGDDDYDGPSLTVTGTVILWRVRQGFRNKELLVRDEDIAPLPEGVEYTAPIQSSVRPVLLTHHCPLEEEYERQLELAAASRPRLRLTDQRTSQICLPRTVYHD